MRSAILISAAVLLLAGPSLRAAELSDKDAVIAVDFGAGWAEGKSDDPAVKLKAQRGKSVLEFTRLDSELSDYYLKARLKEAAEPLRSRGAAFSGEARPVSLHGVSNAYYSVYEMAGSNCLAFFTYNGASFSVAARNVSEAECRGVLATVRRPGEKIELPKPKPVRVRKVREPEPEPEPDYTPMVLPEAAVSTAAPAGTPGSTETAGGTAGHTAADAAAAAQQMAGSAGRAAQGLLTGLAANTGDKGEAPYLARSPLPLNLWLLLLAAWFAGAFAARRVGLAYQNPKLSPPPADVPPDFFFPFMITRFGFAGETMYSVVTRQKQALQASYPHPHEPWLAGAVFAGLAFHLLWSLLDAFGFGGAVTGALLWLPGGRFFASAPEVLLLPALVYGLTQYAPGRQVLSVYDAQSNLVMEGRPEMAYCLIKDGAGKEVARLVSREGGPARRWDFVDTDSVVLFSIVDDNPRTRLLRKLFGAQGGALRTRYGVFVQDRRAGFVFYDPSSPDRFQIHLDFDYGRLSHPAQIMTALLYVISREKDPAYPSPF
jgi:hypothetical protein